VPCHLRENEEVPNYKSDITKNKEHSKLNEEANIMKLGSPSSGCSITAGYSAQLKLFLDKTENLSWR
jgi:hypothetical protein